MAPLVQERVAVLGEVPAMVDFLFLDAPPMDDDVVGEVGRKRRAGGLDPVGGHRRLRGTGRRVDRDALHSATLAVAEGVGRKLGKAQAPIRVAVTGRRVGPPLFEALEVLGPERTLARLRAARELAQADPARSPSPDSPDSPG